VELVNRFYGHADIAVGIAHHGVTPETTVASSTTAFQKPNYTQWLSERRNPDGSLVYPHRLIDGSKAQDAVVLLRKTLEMQPDSSVLMIQIGFSTNLARLMSSLPDRMSSLSGRELIKKKVRLLSVMAGNFDNGDGVVNTPEFNLRLDTPNAQELFDRWPTPVVASGSEIGRRMLFPAVSIEHDFTYAKNHPIADTYRYYHVEGTYTEDGQTRTVSLKWPHDHHTADLTAVLYAARPDRDYFSLSKPGKITVLPDGSARFDEVEGGAHRHLILSEGQKGRALEAMVMLASQPPKRQRHPDGRSEQSAAKDKD
jgi:inosine-uridine nucleoside N-ribohydrolase